MELRSPASGKRVFTCHDVCEALGFEADDPTKPAALQCIGRALAKAYRDKHEGKPPGKLTDPREQTQYQIYYYTQSEENFSKALELSQAALDAAGKRAARAARGTHDT